MTKRNAIRLTSFLRNLSPGLLALALVAGSPHADASQWLKLTAPVKGSSTAPLATTVKFEYKIDVAGFRQFTHSNDPLGTWITVCTGACTSSADIIDSHELTPAEQTTTSLLISKIKQHLTDKHLPLSTQIKWNLMFHIAGTFYDPNERQTNSDFYLGHVEVAVPIHVEAKPTATATPKPIH